MFHTFSHCEKNIKLHIIEVGNKDLKHAVIFFRLDVDQFFSLIKNLSLDYFRIILVYRCETLSQDFLINDFLKGMKYLIDSLEMEDTHCILESSPNDEYKNSLYSSDLFNAITVCKKLDDLCLDTFLASYAQKNKGGIDFIEKVNIQINNTLSEGEPYLIKVAKKMRLTPRVLSKRIRSEGEEFKLLVKQKRHEKALALLKNEDVRLSDVAYTLGYTEHSAFTRAFKNWAGCSPCQFRKYLK
ncbi:helix-turn-helix domain-containing protein [Acinetobacter sp. ANC 3882]|uniref:helix-turn-helix domain-containing protein n=1 Tax=Acinetobacter sp. ANC 3882 TaxID=2923423 RepID=UPI001F4A2701|nr:helix-turn-helix domain-containing protein [Acinetobacter sp. ANC 3882]MCH7316219.1 AraC family transcriptional regulator [Acinetobacter sp. ANC 3882]